MPVVLQQNPLSQRVNQRQPLRLRLKVKRRLPPALQLRLPADPDDGVRQRLAYNAKATRGALETLAAGPPDAAAERARARLAAGSTLTIATKLPN